MTYDGRPYFSAPGIPAKAWHSDGPTTGDVLHHALIAGYYTARKNSRLVWCYQRPMDASSPSAYALSQGHSLVQGALTEVASTDAYIPNEATHFYAAIYYGVIASAETTVAHTVTVQETGGGDDNSATLEQPVQPTPLSGALTAGGKSAGKEAAIPAKDWWATSVSDAGYKEVALAVVRVDLANLTRNTDMRVTIETELNIAASDLCMYQLLSVVAWWEVES